jgi:hypothetical protein
MLSTKSVEEVWKVGRKSDSLKKFESMQEFKMAMATLDRAFQKVMPWNMAFKTLHIFLTSTNYRESDLPPPTSYSSWQILLRKFSQGTLDPDKRKNWIYP